MTRQAPSISATECEVGTRKKGNDGKSWIVVKVKGGVQRWKKVEDKFGSFTKGKKPLTLAAVKKLKPKAKLKLCVFLFDNEKVDRFSFAFSSLAPITGRNKKWYSHEIHGTSSYLEDLPMLVLKNGEIRIVLSSDISPVYLA